MKKIHFTRANVRTHARTRMSLQLIEKYRKEIKRLQKQVEVTWEIYMDATKRLSDCFDENCELKEKLNHETNQDITPNIKD